MKKIITFLLVLTLAGAMATTAFAAQEEAAETITASAADESGPMSVTTEGRGQVAVSIDGSEPVFDDEYPMQTATINPSVVDTVTIGAKADEGWTFAYWINADTGAFYSADAIITVEVTGNLNLKAVFADDSLLTVTAIREGNGQIAISLDGSDPVFDDENPVQNAGASVSAGDTIILGAKADEGWNFVYWIKADTGEFYSADAVISVEVTGNLNLKAVFADASLLTVTAIREGNGQIAISLDGSDPVFDDENPMQNAGASVSAGDTVILGAKADEGWTFAYWINADTGEFYSADAIITVEVTGSLNLKAVFADDSLMSVTASTEGNGQIAISLDGSDPEFDDEFPKQNVGASVNVGDTVIFGAKADEGWIFTGWRYADTNEFYSDKATISIEVTETLNLVAVFEEEMIVEPAEESSKPISPAVDTPKTGDTASAIAVSAVLLSSLTAALFLAVKRRKDEQE